MERAEVAINFAGVEDLATKRVLVLKEKGDSISIECWDLRDRTRFQLLESEFGAGGGRFRAKFKKPSSGYTFVSAFSHVVSGSISEPDRLNESFRSLYGDEGPIYWVKTKTVPPG